MTDRLIRHDRCTPAPLLALLCCLGCGPLQVGEASVATTIAGKSVHATHAVFAHNTSSSTVFIWLTNRSDACKLVQTSSNGANMDSVYLQLDSPSLDNGVAWPRGAYKISSRDDDVNYASVAKLDGQCSDQLSAGDSASGAINVTKNTYTGDNLGNPQGDVSHSVIAGDFKTHLSSGEDVSGSFNASYCAWVEANDDTVGCVQ